MDSRFCRNDGRLIYDAIALESGVDAVYHRRIAFPPERQSRTEVEEHRTMRENTMKQKLAAGQPVFGSMITFPSPQVVEMLGYLGYDWVLIDNEHGSITIDLAEDMIRAAEYSGTAPIVRPVGNRPEIISPFLDRGAWGVQVPHVNTAAEARAAVSAVKYFPEGERGLFSGGRPAEYGFNQATPDYVADANRNTLVCLMLEEVEAIENIPELVKVPGVDVYFHRRRRPVAEHGLPWPADPPGGAGAGGEGSAADCGVRDNGRVQLPGQPGAPLPGAGRPLLPQHRGAADPGGQQRVPEDHAGGGGRVIIARMRRLKSASIAGGKQNAD